MVVRHHNDFRFDNERVPAASVRPTLLLNGAGEVEICVCGASDPAHIEEACRRAVQTVGLETSASPSILQRVEPEIEKLAVLLRLDMMPSKVYTLIAESVSGRLTPPSS